MNRRTFLTHATGGVAGLQAAGAAAARERTESRTNESSSSNATRTSDDGASGDAASSKGGKTHTVGMYSESGNVYFDPIGLHVQPGDTVKWVIESGDHSVTSYTKDNPQVKNRRIPETASSFDSGVLEEDGATFEHTFTVEGTYDYYCIPHKQLGMVGRVVCGKPGGPGAAGSIPDKPGSGLMPGSKDIVDAGTISYPYVPDTGGGGPPLLFWAGLSSLALTGVYLLSDYDRRSGRYGQQNIESLDE